jgi:Xaa-Pro aminopeptidase
MPNSISWPNSTSLSKGHRLGHDEAGARRKGGAHGSPGGSASGVTVQARFPVGTTGSQLDVLARYALWQVGLDYDHGTGHGVGAYLSVHEGPHRISKMPNSVALQPGMIVSNEPGYYKAGAYGIRIENLVAVKEVEIEGADRRYLEFETLTLAPIDLACIEPSALTEAERQWLNDYHRRVRDTVGPTVDEATRGWLDSATRAI